MLYKCVGTKTSALTALTIISAATIMPRIKSFKLSNTGTVSTDSNFEVTVKRFTAAGTTTAITPASPDPGAPAATFTAGSNATIEPTYTANTLLEDVAVNPRSVFSWFPEGPDADLVLPATAANGVGFLVAALGGATTVIVAAMVQQ